MKLLLLGTGGMAHNHATAFKAMEDVEVVACADTNAEAAQTFAETYAIPSVYGSVDDAIFAGGFDAAANVTPDSAHFGTTLKLLEAGCHVFCEKPLATNLQDAAEMAEAAGSAGLINGVNLIYRNVSALRKAQHLIRGGALGDIRHIEASYLQSWLTQPRWGDWKSELTWLWRLSRRHGSHGVLGDVGIHVLDFATFAAGSDIRSITCQLKTFDKVPDNKIGEYTLDANDSVSMTIELDNEATGVVHASRFASGHINDLSLKIFGTKGGLHVTNQGAVGTLKICVDDALSAAHWSDVAVEPSLTLYQQFADAVRTGEMMQPDFAVAARLQGVIDGAVEADAIGRRILVG